MSDEKQILDALLHAPNLYEWIEHQGLSQHAVLEAVGTHWEYLEAVGKGGGTVRLLINDDTGFRLMEGDWSSFPSQGWSVVRRGKA